MAETKMGEFKYTSWTLHMSFIIIFSNIIGLALKEWHGASKRTLKVIYLGIAVLIISTVIVGYGNYFKSIM